MGNGVLHGAGAFAKLMFSVFIVIAVFLVTLMAGVILAVPLFDMGFMELLNNLSNIGDPEYTRLLKYFQMVQSIGLFVIPPFMLAWFFSGNIMRYLYLDKKPGWRTIILTTFIMLAAIPVINLMAYLNSQLTLPESWSALEEWMQRTEEAAKHLTESFLAADDIGGLLFNLFLIAVIPAIGEELLFRGVIQRLFAEWTRNKHAGIWISAILFSAMHMQFYGFLPRTVLGALFGYMLVWSGRMWVPIIAHFVNNAVAVIVYYFISKDKISDSVETIGAERGDWLYAFVSLLFFMLFMIAFYNRERPGFSYRGRT